MAEVIFTSNTDTFEWFAVKRRRVFLSVNVFCKIFFNTQKYLRKLTASMHNRDKRS
jgi:hypothetical protein